MNVLVKVIIGLLLTGTLFLGLSILSLIPKIRYGEFPFYLIYEIDGEQIRIDDTIVSYFSGIGANSARGIHIRWNLRLASGSKPNILSRRDQDYYGFFLFTGSLQGNSTTIFFDVGHPPYWLGYEHYTDYSPGSVFLSRRGYSGIITEDELWDVYKIRIIEAKLAEPMSGNHTH